MLKHFIYLIIGAGLTACSSVNTIYVTSKLVSVSADFQKKNVVDTIVSPYRSELGEEMLEVIARAENNFAKSRPNGSLNNWAADAILNSVDKSVFNLAPYFCLLNVGGLRNPLNKGDVRLEDAYKLMPFDNEIVVVELPLSSLTDVADYLVERGGEPISNVVLRDNKLEIKQSNGKFNWGITTSQSYLPLDNNAFFENKLSLVDWLRQWAKNDEEREEVYIRGFLGKMIFSGEEALKTSDVLSGGEKVRCMLSRMMMLRSNVLMFDEPTSHLDLESITALNGVSRRFELIQQVRAEEENVLLLDAGDIFQGTPYFNKFGGVLEMKLMTALGYDAATMGNHDFDGGMDGFVNAQQSANFPFLCSNYDFNNTPIDGYTQDYTIIQKGNVKVGIFGVGIELKGLVSGRKFGETVYLDPIEIANAKALELKDRGCDLVICLSHLGYAYEKDKVSDRILAQQTKNIHLIIGGHTHTFLDRPTEEKNLDGQAVLINQVGWAGINVGRIDFNFEQN